ncbi:MAG: MotA/TolQ/ExbB proton channel family protein [Planctomycetota bacterium]|jgi:biopolymer transport protein ExbB|nr:MotA/TolQ/ExbB proton channel family protein [Planctomycetota bacterium]
MIVQILLVICAFGFVAADLGAAEGVPEGAAPVVETTAETVAGTAAGAVATSGKEQLIAEVDYIEELQKGGYTAVALVLLMMAGITFAVERLFTLRGSRIAPGGFADQADEMWHRGDFQGVRDLCTKRPSTLARMVAILVQHRKADPEMVIPTAADLAAREQRAQNQKTFSLAAVAALAPLLGLLGTMIGMIESFKLVEQYGDEGGASMLAGSISKALITTAVGLIIAIPAMAVYYAIKHRTAAVFTRLDEEFERLVCSWALGTGEDDAERARANQALREAKAGTSSEQADEEPELVAAGSAESL